MVKRVWSRTLIRRGRILEHARELARTGKYQDHLSILAEVRQLPDSRMVEERWFQTPDFLRQLDLTCAEARNKPTKDERRQGSIVPGRRGARQGRGQAPGRWCGRPAQLSGLMR